MTHFVIPAKTIHSRFTPKKHSFEYPIFYFGIWIYDKYSQEIVVPSLLFNINRWALFSIWADDYLSGADSKDLYVKLVHHLNKLTSEEYVNRITRVLFITTPRVLGYSFNPLSIYYLFENELLLGTVLEVNNTFSEKHVYICNDSNEQAEKILGYEKRFIVKRAFHVSPFNNRSGYYDCSFKNPIGNNVLDVLLKIKGYRTNSGGNPENTTMIARVIGKLEPLDRSTLIYFAFVYGLNAFLTVPRILFQAFFLAFVHKLKVLQRPNPYDHEIDKGKSGITVKTKLLSDFDRFALSKMLQIIETQAQTKGINIKVSFAYPYEQQEWIFGGMTDIIELKLYNSWLCKKLLFESTGIALSSTFIRRDWETNNLLEILRLFSTHTTKTTYIEFPFDDKQFLSISETCKLSFWEKSMIYIQSVLVSFEEKWFTLITNFELNPYTVKQRIIEYSHEIDSSKEENLKYYDDATTMYEIEKHRFHLFKKDYEKISKSE